MTTKQIKERHLQVPANILPSEGILQELLPCLCHLAFVVEQEVVGQVVAQVEHLNEHQQVQAGLLWILF